MLEKEYKKTKAQLLAETDYCQLVVHKVGRTNYIPAKIYDSITNSFYPNPEYRF